MEEKKEKKFETKKLSYDELARLANEDFEGYKKVLSQLEMANYTNVFKRLDYLFKIIENSNHFTNDFVAKCTAEIVDIMTVKEDFTAPAGKED